MMMIDEDTGKQEAAPWHVWLVGALALSWFAYGGYVLYMIVLGGPDFHARMGAGQRELFSGMPVWAYIAIAVEILAGMAGVVAMVLRHRRAPLLLAASLIGAAISFAYALGLANGLHLQGLGGPGDAILAAVFGLTLLAYAIRVSPSREARDFDDRVFD